MYWLSVNTVWDKTEIKQLWSFIGCEILRLIKYIKNYNEEWKIRIYLKEEKNAKRGLYSERFYLEQ